MNVGMIDLTVKSENIMNKLDKSLQMFHLFTSVPSVALTTIKIKKINSVLPIF